MNERIEPESAEMWNELEWRAALDADDETHPAMYVWLWVVILLICGGTFWTLAGLIR